LTRENLQTFDLAGIGEALIPAGSHPKGRQGAALAYAKSLKTAENGMPQRSMACYDFLISDIFAIGLIWRFEKHLIYN
jgi:hypothetical protein